MLTIYGFWFAVKTALTFISPALVQMFSVMKCLWPTRVAVERARGYHVFAQSRGRSLCAVESAAWRWSLSMVTSLLWTPEIVELSQSLTPASSSHGRRIWFLGIRWHSVSLLQCLESASASVLMRWNRVDFLEASPQVISASATIANLLHRARMPRILEHACDSWFVNTMPPKKTKATVKS